MIDGQLKIISDPPFKHFTEYSLYSELTMDLFQSTLIAISNYIITEKNKGIMYNILSNKSGSEISCFRQLKNILDNEDQYISRDYQEWLQKNNVEFNNTLSTYLQMPITKQITKDFQQKINSEFGITIQVITDIPIQQQQQQIEAQILIINYKDKYYQLFKGRCSGCSTLSRKLQVCKECPHKYCQYCLQTSLFGLCSISQCLGENCQKILSINDYFDCKSFCCSTCKKYDQDTCVRLNCTHYVCVEQLTSNSIRTCPECQAPINAQEILQKNESRNCSYCDQGSYNCYQLYNCSHIACPDCKKHQIEGECFLCDEEAVPELKSRSKNIRIQDIHSTINEQQTYCPICKQRNYYPKEMQYAECKSCGCQICLIHGEDAYKCCRSICRVCGTVLTKTEFNHKDYLKCEKCEKMICLYCRKRVQLKQLHMCDLQPIKAPLDPDTDKFKRQFQCCSCLLEGDDNLLGEQVKDKIKCVICSFHQELSEYRVQFTKQKKKFKLQTLQSTSSLLHQQAQVLGYRNPYGLTQNIDYEGID